MKRSCRRHNRGSGAATPGGAGAPCPPPGARRARSFFRARLIDVWPPRGSKEEAALKSTSTGNEAAPPPGAGLGAQAGPRRSWPRRRGHAPRGTLSGAAGSGPGGASPPRGVAGGRLGDEAGAAASVGDNSRAGRLQRGLPTATFFQ